MPLVCIVEGDGEVRAVPVLVRRIASEVLHRDDIRVDTIRVRRGKFLNRVEERRRVFQLAAARSGSSGGVLVLLDADGDCAAQVSAAVLKFATEEIGHVRCRCVLAVREFEAWFLAAAHSLSGARNLAADLHPPENPEGVRDAKGWLAERRSPSRYAPTIDQPAFAARFDLTQARGGAPSFDKFCRDVESLIALVPGADVQV